MKIIKFYLVLLILVFCVTKSPAQSKKVLEARLDALSSKIELLNAEIQLLKEQNKNQDKEISTLILQLSDAEKEIENLKMQNSELYKQSTNTHSGIDGNAQAEQKGERRCKAITSSGNQCSRKADDGSDYCWQHKKTYEPDKELYKSNATQPADNGRTIYTGPKGGRYYINSKGNKVYIKR